MKVEAFDLLKAQHVINKMSELNQSRVSVEVDHSSRNAFMLPVI